MSKEYYIHFRTPEQKVVQAIWDSMDVRALERNDIPVLNTITTGIITTDNPVDVNQYKSKLQKVFKEDGYELVGLEEV